jgi:hypothetical protein
MNEVVKSIGRSIIVGLGAVLSVFMFVLIHGWPIYIMFSLTAIIFLLAGISISKWNRKSHWYSGFFVTLIFWILLSTGQSSDEVALLPLIGLIFVYVGSYISTNLKFLRNSGDNKPNRSRVFSIAGALCLIPPVLNWGLWIYTFSSHPILTPQEKTDIFLGYFPAFIRNVQGISLIMIILLVFSIVLSSIAMKQNSSRLKIMNICVIILGGLITLLQLFTML